MPVHDAADCRAQNCHDHAQPPPPPHLTEKEDE